MKKCPQCKKDLPSEMYRKNKLKKDGLDGWCKQCRSKNINKEKAIIRKRKFYEKCDTEYWRKYRKEHWVKIKARELARYHYKERMICSVYNCGEIAERHHHDYNKPLDIIWLCKKHHSKLMGN